MRSLLLSFYYPPDIGPGALRAQSLVEALKIQDKGICIDVMTTLPNRYNSINMSAKKLELNKKITIHRFQLPEHQNGMFDQAIAFAKFFFKVLRQNKFHKYDIVVATSGRLFTAALGAFIAKKNNAKLYLDIRDLFVDTIQDVFGQSPAKILIPTLRFIERWTFMAANKINVVSSGFIPYLKELSVKCEVTVYTNGIDQSFVTTNFNKDHKNIIPMILYAGNIGQGQGLDIIIPNAAKNLGQNFKFTLVGDGGRRKKLEDELSINNIENVELLKPLTREKLMTLYKKADILLLHLNDFYAFNKVLPSKIFEYAATGKPILAGVRGFSAEFLNKNVTGAFVFEPNNIEQMKKSLKKVMEGPSYYDRTDFINKYLRDKIMNKAASEILSL